MANYEKQKKRLEEKMQKAEEKELRRKRKAGALGKEDKEESTEEPEGTPTVRFRNKKGASSVELLEDDGEFIFDGTYNSVREVIAPNGVNPNPLEYMLIEDGGNKLYTMSLYIHKLPKRAKFADTFSSIFNYPGVTTNVRIEPLTQAKASKQLDKRINVLEAEEIDANKNSDTNRHRKIAQKKYDAERFASDIEQGTNSLYRVQFLVTLSSDNLDTLNKSVSELYTRAREKDIELMSCYSVQPEAFLSAAPFNRIFKQSLGPIKTTTVKTHIMDKRSLATIFNHTQNPFSHENGVVLGYNLHLGHPVLFDVYDKSHNGYGVVVAGKTGTGKSVTVKSLCSRYIDFGFKVVSIDYDSVGNVGEYSIMAHEVGGVSFQLKANSKNILNLFEFEPDIVYDEISGTEYLELDLISKIADMKNILGTMVKNGKDTSELDTAIFLEDIITDCVRELYLERGIVDQDVDSLYTTGDDFVDGKLVTGRIKKELPTIHDFYMKVLAKQKGNRNTLYDKAYAMVVASMRSYVKEAIYCEDTLREFSPAEYASLPKDESGVPYYKDKEGVIHPVAYVRGIKPYFDGQSTIRLDRNTPMFNIDISQLPKDDKPVAQQIALNYLQENFIKKNSVNPHHVQNLILIIDEAHKSFPYPDARAFIGDLYRCARKKHTSIFCLTQALADFGEYEETKAILKNSTSKLILKQDYQDREYIKSVTPLTDGELEELLSLGGDPNDVEASASRKGEVCLIDNDRVAFVKVVYLKGTEALICETDAVSRQKLFNSMRKER